jgi:signal peptidase II
MAKWARSLALLLIVFGLVGCDQVTKTTAKTYLESSGGVSLVDGVLELSYTENRDVAFNALSRIPEAARQRLLLAGGAFAIAIIYSLLRRSRRNLLLCAALALVLAGAVGNYADRVVRGYVVDFVHVTHWPVFNLADVYVTLGALGLLLLSRRNALNRTG